jgi:cell division protein FtsB
MLDYIQFIVGFVSGCALAFFLVDVRENESASLKLENNSLKRQIHQLQSQKLTNLRKDQYLDNNRKLL